MSSSSTASKLRGLIGLGGAKRLVGKLASGDEATHAVLLYGASGSGKEELAQALAQAWLCLSPAAETGADGTCRACAAFDHGSNPDLLSIRTGGKSAQILDRFIVPNKNPEPGDPLPLITFLRTGPLMSRHKVAIVSDAHRVTHQASNGLLKTLEEPPARAKLILTTDSIGGIRPTILSRCLGIACSTPGEAELLTAFPDATDEDVLLAEGAPGRLKAILDHAEAYRALVEFARSLADRPMAAALVTSEEFRLIAERIGSECDLGSARAANAEALAALAIVLVRDKSLPQGGALDVIEAHQRVLANASPAVVFDALFARLLGS